MTKFAMVSLYSIGLLFSVFAALGFVFTLSGSVEFAQAFGAFIAGAVFLGLAAIIELLRKIAS